eukprot:CAMPEP_0194546488 /NCGR_PEP_ID=MMETSP0253-20130528/90727_1 /TAXON_ID=2966 /ORGANISM="Noctiluca scintillans" /LENGTH=532 /DNA_ID=CAMNT_0039393589 /DNA_START=48 /DNA_END=1643 /DNA_ORIENTATION=+
MFMFSILVTFIATVAGRRLQILPSESLTVDVSAHVTAIEARWSGRSQPRAPGSMISMVWDSEEQCFVQTFQLAEVTSKHVSALALGSNTHKKFRSKNTGDVRPASAQDIEINKTDSEKPNEKMQWSTFSSGGPRNDREEVMSPMSGEAFTPNLTFKTSFNDAKGSHITEETKMETIANKDPSIPSEVVSVSRRVKLTARGSDMEVQKKTKHSHSTKVNNTEKDTHLPYVRLDHEELDDNMNGSLAADAIHEQAPFAQVSTERKTEQTLSDEVLTKTTTTKRKIRVASSRQVLSFFMLMFTPFAVAWSYALRNGHTDYVRLLLPLTYCAFGVANDLVNQSLAMVMQAPFLITTFQTAFMFLVCSCWFLFGQQGQKLSSGWSLESLVSWMVVATFFTGFQLANHVMYADCSLAERTVFQNLKPMLALGIEFFVMPDGKKPLVTRPITMSLSMMVVGALAFALQYPDFSVQGFRSALMFVLVGVPYKLLQRGFLCNNYSLPVSVLAAVDAAFLLVPAPIMSVYTESTDYDVLVSW